MMVTLQGVIILRISDFRRFFDWGEFWSKKDDYISLFKDEIRRHSQEEEYFFVDNDNDFYLLQKFYEWQTYPDNELRRVKLEETKLKIWAECGEVIEYQLGRLQETIEATKKEGYLTNNTIVGYTLLYLLLKANEANSEIEVEYGSFINKNKATIDEFECCRNDIILDKIDIPEFPLRRCVIINKNPYKTISITHGDNLLSLRPNECVVGIFCGNKCLHMLDNVVSDNYSKVTLKLSVKDRSHIPICEIHRPNGIQCIESVSSIAVEADGSIVYSTMNGDICYNKDCFSLDLRITSFKEKEYSKDLLAFKKDSSGNYIFYCKNKINY